jgi:hypothetical protein
LQGNREIYFSGRNCRYITAAHGVSIQENIVKAICHGKNTRFNDIAIKKPRGIASKRKTSNTTKKVSIVKSFTVNYISSRN